MVICGIDLWVVFITMIIVLLIIIIFVSIRLNQATDDDFKQIDYKTIQFKTGDILGVSYPSIRGKLVRVFTGSIWTHIGLIVERNDKLYVMEMAHYSKQERGLVLKPLKEWLDWNYGDKIALRRYSGSKPFPKLNDFIERHQAVVEDLSVVSWLKTCIKRRYRKPRKDYFYCSEFITHTFQSMGMMRRSVSPSSFKPWQLIYGDMGFYPGYSYDQPLILKNINTVTDVDTESSRYETEQGTYIGNDSLESSRYNTYSNLIESSSKSNMNLTEDLSEYITHQDNYVEFSSKSDTNLTKDLSKYIRHQDNYVNCDLGSTNLTEDLSKYITHQDNYVESSSKSNTNLTEDSSEYVTHQEIYIGDNSLETSSYNTDINYLREQDIFNYETYLQTIDDNEFEKLLTDFKSVSV